MSPYRFCLEQMAVRDVFGCMTTGKPPTILKSAFMPWFFEAESWSKDAGEWESVERMFGISRGVVDLIARVRTRVELTGKAYEYRRALLVRKCGTLASPSWSVTPKLEPIQTGLTPRHQIHSTFACRQNSLHPGQWCLVTPHRPLLFRAIWTRTMGTAVATLVGKHWRRRQIN